MSDKGTKVVYKCEKTPVIGPFKFGTQVRHVQIRNTHLVWFQMGTNQPKGCVCILDVNVKKVANKDDHLNVTEFGGKKRKWIWKMSKADITSFLKELQSCKTKMYNRLTISNETIMWQPGHCLRGGCLG